MSLMYPVLHRTAASHEAQFGKQQACRVTQLGIILPKSKIRQTHALEHGKRLDLQQTLTCLLSYLMFSSAPIVLTYL